MPPGSYVTLCINMRTREVHVEEVVRYQLVGNPLKRCKLLKELCDTGDGSEERKVHLDFPAQDIITWDKYVADEYRDPEDPLPRDLARWLQVRSASAPLKPLPLVGT